jgi:elongation factor Ts
MSNVSAGDVKKLREKTGAGMMDCKRALGEADGDFEKAIEILRKMGLKDIGKRAGKIAADGVIGAYVHSNEQVAVLVELNCETDFVARGDEFKRVARDIAMHVAAMKPVYAAVEDIPPEVIAKEKEIALETLTEKQRAVADKILPGKLAKFYSENVLLTQPFVKDEEGKKTVKDIVEELSVKVGEKVTLRRFARFEVGEGIEKAVSNLADEVSATIKGE